MVKDMFDGKITVSNDITKSAADFATVITSTIRARSSKSACDYRFGERRLRASLLFARSGAVSPK